MQDITFTGYNHFKVNIGPNVKVKEYHVANIIFMIRSTHADYNFDKTFKAYM
jgi:hypothetical protein